VEAAKDLGERLPKAWPAKGQRLRCVIALTPKTLRFARAFAPNERPLVNDNMLV
jgi:hypothetical protein